MVHILHISVHYNIFTFFFFDNVNFNLQHLVRERWEGVREVIRAEGGRGRKRRGEKKS